MIENWLSQYGQDERPGVIASPDVDGVLSIALIELWRQQQQKNNTESAHSVAPVQIVGIYTTTDLLLCDHCTTDDARRALWVDHDVLDNVRCIGNHLIELDNTAFNACTLPNRHPLSFNLNASVGHDYRRSFHAARRGRDKYPFGTAHLLTHALLRTRADAKFAAQPYAPIFAWLAHADGAWSTATQYAASAEQHWYAEQFERCAWMSYLFRDYLSDERRFRLHCSVVRDIKNALGAWCDTGSSATGNGSGNNAGAGFAWHLVRGHQGAQRCDARSRPLALNGPWLGAFNALLSLVFRSACNIDQKNVPRIGSISSAIFGRVSTPNPSQAWANNAAFVNAMRQERVFSLAFVSKWRVRYTTAQQASTAFLDATPTPLQQNTAPAIEKRPLPNAGALQLDLSRANLIVYDLETTGLHRHDDRIIQMAFGVACGRTLNWLCEPRALLVRSALICFQTKKNDTDFCF